MDADEYLFFVRFLVGLIVTVGIVVLSIKLGIDVVAGAV
jgi:hypothetical protein